MCGEKKSDCSQSTLKFRRREIYSELIQGSKSSDKGSDTLSVGEVQNCNAGVE